MDASKLPVRIVREQKAVLRTNCMDCLDRTNVVQSTFARDVLNEQLRHAGVFKNGDGIEKHAELWHTFRNVWADHADVISKAYSGTGALKTDFTRTGKRSKEGALQDGINSLTRYVKNNFFDGSRQDAYDLFTGAWNPREKQLALDQRALLVRSMPWVFFFSVVMIFSAVILPRETGESLRDSRITLRTLNMFRRDSATSMTYFIAAWIVIATVSFNYMVARGIDYVDWPRLNRPEESIYYGELNGDGFHTPLSIGPPLTIGARPLAEGAGFYSGRKGRGGVKGHAGKNMKKTERLIKAPVTNTEGNVSRRHRRGAEYAAEE